MWDTENVRKVTVEILKQAIKYRHNHKGIMSNYKIAKQIVDKANEGIEPTFASWF